MMHLSVRDLLTLDWMASTLPEPLLEKSMPSISTDSRTLVKGEAFLALSGHNFDGHAFIPQALTNGALFCIVSGKWFRKYSKDYPSRPFLVVKDTLETYGRIARMHRRLFDIPVIAITGSNGKTSTKELIAAVLETKYRVLKTEGNYNNQIGLPKTLLQICPDHDAVVIELGTNQPGDISTLCSIAEPTHSLVTNIGTAHIEKLLSKEGIAAEKCEIYRCLPKNGIVFVNTDEPLIKKYIMRGQKKMSFGSASTSDIRIREVKLDAAGNPTVWLEAPKFHGIAMKLKLGVAGRHSAYNAAAAIAVGFAFSCTARNMKRVIESYEAFEKRLHVRKLEGLTILDDSYNANPDSVLAALDTLSALNIKGKKFAVLGDMLELGAASRAEHLLVGEAVARMGIDYVLTIGTLSKEISRAAEPGVEFAGHFRDRSELMQALTALLTPGDAVLVKGSRGMKMEELVLLLLNQAASWKEST